MTEPLLEATGLVKRFRVRGVGRRSATLVAVDDVELRLHQGRTLGLVGESGCGKSTAARLLTRLLEPSAGRILFAGQDITHLRGRALRPLRRQIQLIFQDPFASLNPRRTVGAILAAPYRYQGLRPRQGEGAAVGELLEMVGLTARYAGRFPHELSGGQAQRVGIARALALRPALLVCDEPVSSLDVSVQAQILNLLLDLRTDLGLSYVFIAHDLAVVRQVCEQVAVMYLGGIVETADRDAIFARPAHPYTVALLSAVPSPDPDLERQRRRVLLPGDPPSPLAPPSGCRFRTRCWKAQQRCAQERPVLSELTPGHRVACHYPENGARV